MRNLYLSYALTLYIFFQITCAPPTNIADDPNSAFIKAFSVSTSQSSFPSGPYTDTINTMYYFRTRIVLARHIDSIHLNLIGRQNPLDTIKRNRMVAHHNSEDDHDSVYIDSVKITVADTFNLLCKAFIVNGKILDTNIQFITKGNPVQFTKDLDSNNYVVEGNSYTFSVKVTGTAPFTYEWSHNKAKITNNSPNLTIANATSENQGEYECKVMNAYGSAITSKKAILYVVNNGSNTDRPSKVKNIKILERNYCSAFLTWQKNTTTDTFKVFRSMKRDSGFTLVGSLFDTLLVDSIETKTYYYYITAHNKNGTSPSSDTISTELALKYLNSKPSLQIEGNRHFEINAICTLTIRASDPDYPIQQAPFITILDNPAGSSFNQASGTFIWRSTTEQTAIIKFIATDKGNPSLADTIPITITFSNQLFPPNKPTGLQIVERSASTAWLKWNTSARVDTFRIYRATSTKNNFQLIKATVDTSYRDTGLIATRYFYYIKSFNSTGPSPSSDTISTDSAKLYINGKPKVNVSGNTNYIFGDTCTLITTAIDQDFPAQAITIKAEPLPNGATFDGNKFIWKPSGFISDLIDTIKFIATDNGTPNLSDTIKIGVKFTSTIKPPTKPTNIQITERSAFSDSIKWTIPANTDSIKIYRNTSRTGSYQLVATTTGTQFKDVNLQPQTTYYYYVTAVNKAGLSPSSDTISTQQATRFVNAIPQFTIEPVNHAIKQNALDTLKFSAKDNDLDNLTFEILKLDSLLALFPSTTPKPIELVSNGLNALILFRPGNKTGEITFNLKVSDGKAADTSIVKVNVTIEEATLNVVAPELAGSGTSLPSAGSSTLIAANTPYQLSATPSAGYVFVKWTTVSGSAVFADSNVFNTKVTIGRGTTTIKPVFAKKKFTLTITTIGTGSTTPSAGSIQIDSGTVQTLTATAGSGYRFSGFVVVGANQKVHLTTSPSSSVWLEGDGQIQAIFLKQFTVTMKSTGNGTVNANKTSVDSGEVIYISATANSGNGFEKWMPSSTATIDNLTSASTTAKISGNATIEASFKLGTYQLTISSSTGGTTTPNNIVTVSHGVAQSIKAIPTVGYKFIGWTASEGNPVFASTSAESTTVTCTGITKIMANFSKLTYNLTITNYGNGTTTASPSSVNHGEPFPISATPNANFTFSSWTIVSGSASFASATSSSTTVTLTSGNASIRANFTALEKCATPTFTPSGGTINANSKVTISCATQGSTIYYTTNGSDPTTSSSVYNAQLTISSNTTIKALAVKSGFQNSSIGSASFTINQVPTITNCPTIDTAGVGNFYSFAISASDPDGQSISYKLLNNPIGMTISQNKLHWFVNWNTSINITVPVSVEISDGLSSTQCNWNIIISPHRWKVIANVSSEAPPACATDSMLLFRYRADAIEKSIDQGKNWAVFQETNTMYTLMAGPISYKNVIFIAYGASEYSHFESFDAQNGIGLSTHDEMNKGETRFAQIANGVPYCVTTYWGMGYSHSLLYKDNVYYDLPLNFEVNAFTVAENGNTYFVSNSSYLYRNISGNWNNWDSIQAPSNFASNAQIKTDGNNGDTIFTISYGYLNRIINASGLTPVFSNPINSRNISYNNFEALDGYTLWLIGQDKKVYFTNTSFNQPLTIESLPAEIERIFLAADRKTIFAYGNGKLYR